MSETNRDQKPTLVEGELSLDDLSQIAGGTLTPLDNPFDNSNVLAASDSMFSSFEGASGTSLGNQNMVATPMNLSLSFP